MEAQDAAAEAEAEAAAEEVPATDATPGEEAEDSPAQSGD
jgi:hypothetical protein